MMAITCLFPNSVKVGLSPNCQWLSIGKDGLLAKLQSHVGMASISVMELLTCVNIMIYMNIL